MTMREKQTFFVSAMEIQTENWGLPRISSEQEIFFFDRFSKERKKRVLFCVSTTNV